MPRALLTAGDCSLVAECLCDALPHPISWNHWQTSLSQLSRQLGIIVPTPCSTQWRTAMLQRFGPRWPNDLQTLDIATLQTATQAFQAKTQAASPDHASQLLALLDQPLPWNSWQSLVCSINRSLRSHQSSPSYSDYCKNMAAQFGADWQAQLPPPTLALLIVKDLLKAYLHRRGSLQRAPKRHPFRSTTHRLQKSIFKLTSVFKDLEQLSCVQGQPLLRKMSKTIEQVQRCLISSRCFRTPRRTASKSTSSSMTDVI